MKFDRNEKTIKMALSFSESDDFENFTKISVVVWYLYAFLGHINDHHCLKKIKNRNILHIIILVKSAGQFARASQSERYLIFMGRQPHPNVAI